MKVLIVYYSTYGNVYRMATLVAEGVKEIPGVQPVVRTVPELIPQSVIEAREDMKAGREMQQNVPLVTLEDFRNAGAYAFGTPTRFGNVSAQLKNQIDQLTSLWLKGELEGKPAGVFVATGSLHGGQETTLLSMMLPLLHHGMMLVGLPYTAEALHRTTTGGSPYGASQVSGGGRQGELSGDERELAQLLGRRLATAAKALKSTRG